MGGSTRPSSGGIGGPEADDCARLRLQTTLASPVGAVLERLAVGSKLEVRRQGNSAVAVTDAGAVAGAITGAGLPRLLSCLDEGYRFIATVTVRNGGQCTVDVRGA